MTRDEVLGLSEGVGSLVLELEGLLVGVMPGKRQQALAVALWRTMNADGLRDGGDWTLDGVRLENGGRRIIAELTMTPPKGTRVDGSG